jgi:hypothetical protein
MFAIVITIALLILLAAGFSLYSLKSARSRKSDDWQLPKPAFDGLFPAPDVVSAAGQSMVDTPAYRRAKLLDRARGGALETLSEACGAGDPALFEDVLNALIESASNNREAMGALVSRITGGTELRANKRLAELVIEEWKANPDVASTGAMAHVAALSDDAATYERVVDLIVSYWKAGRLPELSADQVIEIVESQYWILSHEARHGGEGFPLKIKFVKLRRELAAATPAR